MHANQEREDWEMAREMVLTRRQVGTVTFTDRTSVYDSLSEFADAAARHYDPNVCAGNWDYDNHWAGASHDDARTMARNGWSEQLSEAIEAAESAVKLCEQEHNQFTFAPVFDVAGGTVDVARFLAGEPECMVDYPLTVTSKVGRVITLCAGVCYSFAISADSIIRRGQYITALALALSRLGHNTELWADISIGKGKKVIRLRVLVKGANDVIDPAKVLYAFAHPSMLRRLGFAACAQAPESYARTGSGSVQQPLEDLPDGAMYLPSIRSESDIPELHEQLERSLRELGLISD